MFIDLIDNNLGEELGRGWAGVGVVWARRASGGADGRRAAVARRARMGVGQVRPGGRQAASRER